MRYAYKAGYVYGMPLMKFTLTYDGELPSATSNNPRTKEKWDIRKYLDPQLRELWGSSDILREIERNKLLPTSTSFMRTETHHSLKIKTELAGPNLPSHKDRMDLCAPIQKGKRSFLPLVRDTFALKCGLKIIFLRTEEPGQLIYQGGDIDNRLKTLFDALGVPSPDQIKDIDDQSIVDPIHCVVEDDRLISSLEIDTQKLLSRPNASIHEVRLIIDVDVRVIQSRSYNQPFLAD